MKSLKSVVGCIIIGMTIISCLDDEPVSNVNYKYSEIDSIQIGEINPARSVTEIKTFFTRNNSCETFFDYDYQISGNERSVSIITADVVNNVTNCADISEGVAHTLLFKPDVSGTYTFRFWAGNDENEEPIFIVKELEIP